MPIFLWSRFAVASFFADSLQGGHRNVPLMNQRKLTLALAACVYSLSLYLSLPASFRLSPSLVSARFFSQK